MNNERIAAVLQDPGPFASVYVDVSRDTDAGNRMAELHAREAADGLAAQGAPESVITPIRQVLDEVVRLPSPVSRCLVAGERGVLLDGMSRSHRSQPVINFGPLPDVAHWLGDEAEATTFLLVLLDHEGGDLTTFSSRTMEPIKATEAGEPSPYEHKVRGGGLAHYRFQRTSETVWADNADAVLTEIDRRLTDEVDLMLIGGEPDMRNKVLSGEQKSWPEVIVLEGVNRNTEDSSMADRIMREADSAIRARAMAHRLAAVHQLRDRMGQGSGSATGVADTISALVQGQVERLLLDPDAAAEQVVDPADHPGVSLGSVRADQPLRADQLLVSLGALTDAEIVITRARTMAGAPAAAVLRW